MKQVGLRFLLQGGLFLSVAMPSSEAQVIIREWSSGELRQRGKTVSGVCNITGSVWSVLVDSITAIHTEQLQQQAAQQTFGQGYGSGRN